MIQERIDYDPNKSRGESLTAEFYRENPRSWQIRLVCRDIVRNMKAQMYDPEVAKDPVIKENLREALVLHRKRLDSLGIESGGQIDGAGLWAKEMYIDPVITAERLARIVYQLAERPIVSNYELDAGQRKIEKFSKKGSKPDHKWLDDHFEKLLDFQDTDFRLNQVQRCFHFPRSFIGKY